jgi:hypothetical protein
MNSVGWKGYSEMTAGFLNAWHDGNADVNHIVGTGVNIGFGNGVTMDSSAQIWGAYDLKYNTRTRP